MNSRKAEREKLLKKLEELLQAPAANEWAALRRELAKLPTRTLRSLEYRVHAARTDAYEDGLQHGRSEP